MNKFTRAKSNLLARRELTGTGTTTFIIASVLCAKPLPFTQSCTDSLYIPLNQSARD